MAFKQYELEGIGPVTIYKRRGARSVRLSVTHSGKVRVSMPTWLPYASGLSYAQSKRGWLQNQLAQHAQVLHTHGQRIGKAHELYFRADAVSAPRSRIAGSAIIVTHPRDIAADDGAVQQVAEKACLRALRQEAEELLTDRLRQLADQYGFSYRSVSIRLLKSRWGSCDQNRNIKLNLYLMQLPWELIDYVLLHELTHTQIMQHGPKFWQAMEGLLPNIKDLRRQIKAYKTAILH